MGSYDQQAAVLLMIFCQNHVCALPHNGQQTPCLVLTPYTIHKQNKLQGKQTKTKGSGCHTTVWLYTTFKQPLKIHQIQTLSITTQHVTITLYKQRACQPQAYLLFAAQSCKSMGIIRLLAQTFQV
jgi:hypothetical protein